MPTFSTTIIDPLTQRPECLPVQEEAKGSTPLRIAINFIHPFVNAEVNLTHFHRSRRSKSDPPGSFCLRCSGA